MADIRTRHRTQPRPPQDPATCTCRPTRGKEGGMQTWPVILAHHIVDAHYVIRRKHHVKCGLPAELVDAGSYTRRWRGGRR